MYKPFACEALFLVPYSVDVEGGSVLRRASRALGAFEGQHFVPRTSRARSFLSGQGSAVRITFEHPDYNAASGCADCGLSLGVGSAFSDGFDLMLLTVQLGRADEQIDKSWSAACELAPRIIEVLGPSYVFATGKRIDNERSALPSPKSIQTSFPSEVTPLTYLGADALTPEMRLALPSVSAHASQALGDGWLLQAVQRLVDKPPSDFIANCEAIAGHKVRYLSPILESEG